jgi:nickel-dependent lactate racemase
MKFELSYGKGTIGFDIDDSKILQVLVPPGTGAKTCSKKDVKKVLENPVGAGPLLMQLKRDKPEKVVVIVNDITRPTPYDLLLPPLLETFKEAGITDDKVTFVVATGIHDPHSEEENRQVYGEDVCRRFRVVSHEAGNLESLVSLGTLSTGAELRINRLVAEADFVIALGVVMPHYFAGYSGGRKSVMPGVAWKRTVEKNHSRMVELMDDLPEPESNPISLEMIEAARKVDRLFIVNVVVNQDGEATKVVAGDVEQAWKEAVKEASRIYEVPLRGLADVTIAGSCGYPRDINVYQMQKALDHADKATKKGGAIIMVAECPMGYGEPVFEEWINAAKSPDDIISRIRQEFMLGGHKAFGIAKVAAEKKVYLVTSLDETQVNKLFAVKVPSVEEAIQLIESEKGKDLNYIVMPQGSVTVPVPGPEEG